MPHILVASNDLALRTLLRIRFAPWVSVNASATSSEALLRAMDSFPDVVVVDVLAADCNLPRFLDTLRARLPTCKAIILARHVLDSAIACLEAPDTVAVLGRPFEFHQLTIRIEEWLGLPRAGDKRPTINRTLARLITYMNEHYMERLQLRDLAAEVKLSPEHLDHLFSAAVGIGVMHFRMMVRVEAARDLLAATDSKIENVAESIGFYDAPHFSRVFREMTGLRPGRYRQQSSLQTTKAERPTV